MGRTKHLMYTAPLETSVEAPVEPMPTEAVPVQEELPEASVEGSVEAPVEAPVELKLVDINDHPTHGNFTVEIPKSFKDSDVIKYIGNLDLNLMLGIGRSKLKGDDVERIKTFENNSGSGFKSNKWTPVESLEGGTDTLAYGHKLTAKEVESKMIMIGGVEVAYANGITDEQATTLFNQDAEWAKGYAEDSLNKSGLELNANRVQALTSLIFNVGNGAWGKSKAKKYLESGNVEDFMHEAFDPEVGFVKINGEVSRGLVRRRGEEAILFGESDIAEGGGLGTMMSDVLSKINPIREAAADILPPPQETAPQNIPQSIIDAGPGTPKPKQFKPVVATEKIDREGSFLAGLIPSEYRMFASDLLGFNDEKLGINYFGTDEQKAIKIVIDKAIKRTKAEKGPNVTSGRVDYDQDWVAGQTNVSSGSWKLFGSSEDSVQKTLGDQAWRIDDRGHVIVKDRYNFNADKGALGDKASIVAKLKNVADAAAGVATGKLGAYGFIRAGIANSFGSSDADNKGSTFEFDLGPVDKLVKL